MDLFSLTETEFFRQLTEGRNDNLHIAFKDFVLQVNELCHTSTHKGYVISALLYAEVEIIHIQTEKLREAVNQELATFVSKALLTSSLLGYPKICHLIFKHIVIF